MRPSLYHKHLQLSFLSFSSVVILLLTACSGSSIPTLTASSKPTTPAIKQVLTFPSVGISDMSTLDPAADLDANATIVAKMLYSGLVRTDVNLNVIPDQATWQISHDEKVYTFSLNPAVVFSDGTPVTAQSYIYTWTRALLPIVASPDAAMLETPIAGATAMIDGKSQTISGLKAIDAHTLQVTVTQPTPYFLQELTNPLFFPLNQKVIERYGQKKWVSYATTSGIGTGPFQLKEWTHSVKMVFTPSAHYYGNKTKLTQVNMVFMNNPSAAYTSYQAGQFDFDWALAQDDQVGAVAATGFTRVPLLQTDMFFFNNTRPPFNNIAIRQAFAYGTDRKTLLDMLFKDSVLPAPTILPPGMPGYQNNYQGIPYDPLKAQSLIKSAYPDITQMPSIYLTYPNSQISFTEAKALKMMWQTALNIHLDLRPIEWTAYQSEAKNHLIQFGLIQWNADFPDPSNVLAIDGLSTSDQNFGLWKNTQFDQTVTQAEKLTGDARLALYQQAEQIALNDIGFLPLDHQTLTAVIPTTVHGVLLNGNGLYLGDWSDVYLLKR